MQVDLRILRYDPERDAKPHWESYSVDAAPRDRVLNLLQSVKDHQDGTLTFRRSCAHGICGSDAMLINGRNRLACRIRVEQLGRSTLNTVRAAASASTSSPLRLDADDTSSPRSSSISQMVA